VPLAAGTRLGPYEVLAELGAGGMGEVYRARDTRLGREVAVKVLPEAVSTDRERMTRFEMEARSASSLNHPSIVTIYDVGRSGTNSYIAMELVDGVSLRALLGRGRPTVKKTLQIAADLADGLAAAHQKGIVHRDLKPENVIVGKDGRAKILDFGLARVTGPAPREADPTVELGATLTETGVVVGTVGYMSPEQARGEHVGVASDQFSFGSILYEMAAGRRAFSGPNPVDTLSAIMHAEPEPLAAAAPNAPLPLRWVVERCLAKEADERYASTRDLARDLVRLRDGHSESGPSAPSFSARPRFRRWLLPGLAVAATAVALAVFLAARTLVREPPKYHQVTFRRGALGSARFAPDGKTIVYGASFEGRDARIYTNRSGGFDSRPLPLPSASLLSVSTSGKISMLLRPSGVLAEMPIDGSAPRELLEHVEDADYQPGSDRMAIIRRGRLEFPAGTVLCTAGENVVIRSPRFSPKGDCIAHIEERGGGTHVILTDLAGKSRTLGVWLDIYGLVWHPSGKEIWMTARGEKDGVLVLHAVALSGRDRVVERTPGVLKIHDIAKDGRVLMSHEHWTYSILFYPAGGGHERELSWLSFSFGRDLSADGKTLLFDEDEGGRGGVYLRTTDGESPAVRLADGGAMALSPDGKWALGMRVSGQEIVSPSDRITLVPTGAGEQKVIQSPGMEYLQASFFPDGRRILFLGSLEHRPARLYVQDLAAGTPHPITPEKVRMGAISPDGALIAARGPDAAVHLYPSSGSGDARAIPGIRPEEDVLRWSADGRTLFLQQKHRIFRLDVAAGREELWKELTLTDPGAGGEIENVLLTPDGESYAFSRMRVLSDLYVVDGLK
jgi:serine/threonine protein kinase